MTERNQIAVTIIIPVVNDREKLIKTVKSCMEQDLYDLEILLCGGAAEEIRRLCTLFQAQDPRIRITGQNARSAAAAKNAAVRAAVGRYLLFVNPGDELFHDAASAMLERITREDAAICIGSQEFFKDSLEEGTLSAMVPDGVLSGRELLEKLQKKERSRYGSLDGKLIDVRMFTYIHFPENKGLEDAFVVHRLYYRSRRVALYIGAVVLRKEQTADREDLSVALDKVEVLCRRYDFYMKHGLYEDASDLIPVLKEAYFIARSRSIGAIHERARSRELEQSARGIFKHYQTRISFAEKLKIFAPAFWFSGFFGSKKTCPL